MNAGWWDDVAETKMVITQKFRKIVEKDGWGRLWRGFGPCTGRAALGNAAGFYAYEGTVDFLKKHSYFE